MRERQISSHLWFHLYVESKNKQNKLRKQDQICGYRDKGEVGGVGEMDEGGQELLTSSYKINKSLLWP